jgi:cell wall-associated NlpC family hydrolase
VSAPAASASASSTGSTGSGSIQSRPLTLTRSQLRSVQRRLRLRADGVLGARTRAALRRFQRRNDLTAHGRPSVETLRALGLKVADRYEARLTAEAAGPADAAADAPLPAAIAGVAGAIEAARSRIGDPYVSGGTKPGGFDCSGLMVWSFGQAGIKLPRTSFQQYKEGVAVPKTAIAAGDLVFFNTAGPGASHVGVATSPTRVISATSHGVMEHPIATGYWGSHYVGARRITA